MTSANEYASPAHALHEKFFRALGISVAQEDPSNKLLNVETPLAWLKAIGFADVDCPWKWLEFALLRGRKPD